MHRGKYIVLVGAVGALVTAASTAWSDVPEQQLPVARVVKYLIHENPDDPNSDVVMRVKLDLSNQDVSGDSIGWRIDQITLRKPDGAGSDVWIRQDPNVPTADGLWWVEHADIYAPQASEFDMVPHLVGTALAQDPNDSNLSFEFGAAGSGGQDPYTNTAMMNFGFIYVPIPPFPPPPPPVDPGDDEPVEIPPVINPPYET